MDFTIFHDIKCSEATNKLRLRQIKLLNELINHKSDKFYIDGFLNYEETIKKLEEFFDSPTQISKSSFSLETRCSYLASLCKALRFAQKFPKVIYDKYDMYYKKIYDLKESLKHQ